MIMMTVTRLLTIMMTILLAPETMERAPVTTSPMMSRMTLIQQQACSQDMARVVCRCPGELETQGPSYLGVRMQGFLINNNNNNKNNNNIRNQDTSVKAEVNVCTCSVFCSD